MWFMVWVKVQLGVGNMCYEVLFAFVVLMLGIHKEEGGFTSTLRKYKSYLMMISVEIIFLS